MSSARTSFYRPTGQSRRAVRSQQQFDHDVFEGLPIRRWGKQWMWIAKKNIPPPPPPELPLPKDTHLLTPMSQTLLKAARNGTLGQPQDEEKEDAEPKMPTSTRLFMTNKWATIPREEEGPEPEYLGRQPDTFTRRSRLVKKTVNGKVVIVEEEIDDVYPEGHPGAPGGAAVAAAVAAVQPVKRRPPPPRRKPGRGRKPGFKKMVTFAEDGRALPTGEGTATPSGAEGVAGSGAENGEGEDDVEMGDADDGTPDDHDQDNDHEVDHDGEGEQEGEHEIEPAQKMEHTATPEVSATVKKEGTAEPMLISSPPAVPLLSASIDQIMSEKVKSPSPVPPPPAPLEIVPRLEPDPKEEQVPKAESELTLAPVVEALQPAPKSPTPTPTLPASLAAIETLAVKSPPLENPRKRKSPSADVEEGELEDKELGKHEVSIEAAIAERESHDEFLPPVPPS